MTKSDQVKRQSQKHLKSQKTNNTSNLACEEQQQQVWGCWPLLVFHRVHTDKTALKLLKRLKVTILKLYYRHQNQAKSKLSSPVAIALLSISLHKGKRVRTIITGDGACVNLIP